MTADTTEIEGLVHLFFTAFTSGPGCAERRATLRTLFVPEAVITRTCGTDPTVYNIDTFITPRQTLLESGTLVDFHEWPVSGRTEIFGDIAHWWGTYAKEGIQNSVPFTGRGMKSIQFIRTTHGWRITAAAWDDERPGLELPTT